MTKKDKINTILARSGLQTDRAHGAVVPPLYLSSTYSFDGLEGKRDHDYSRMSNPTRDLLTDALAALDGGAGAVFTASGMAALTLLVQLAGQGDLILISHDCFGGTFRLGQALAGKGLYNIRFIDMNNRDALEAAMAEKPAMLIAETPSNPLLRITDIASVTALCRAHGCISVIDNTFLSPVQQRPLDLGADIAWYSTTKYINGHSDSVGGALVFRDSETCDFLTWWAGALGVTGSPFESYMTLRGLRTMDVRIRRQSKNAQAIAEMLAAHPATGAVYYPGLPAHPGHDIAAMQQNGFGGIVSFEVNGGIAAVKALVESLKCFSLAESLGGVESLVCHPATMTHRSMPDTAKEKAGITDNLVRLSVGIEDCEDLLADLDAGL
jgi:cystathionine gamma-synthase